jgi:excisionase family DNA binding protein
MGALEDWLTVHEAAKLTGYNPEQIRRIAREGKVKSQKWGTVWMISRPSLFEYIHGQGRGPKSKQAT